MRAGRLRRPKKSISQLKNRPALYALSIVPLAACGLVEADPPIVGRSSAPASAARPRNSSTRAIADIRSRLLSSASRTSAGSSGSLNSSNHWRSAIDCAWSGLTVAPR
jgi:hypothetical protein